MATAVGNYAHRIALIGYFTLNVEERLRSPLVGNYAHRIALMGYSTQNVEGHL